MALHISYVQKRVTGVRLIVRQLIEGSLEVKLPTIWTDEEQGRGREKRKIRREKGRRERTRKRRCRCAKR